MIGVYKITNTANGKVYIGKTYSNIDRRWKEHVFLLNKGKHTNYLLQKDWDALGKDVFVFDVLETIEWNKPLNFFLEREQYWISQYKQNGCKFYNACNPVKGNRNIWAS
jgi:group I intron endonuclease